MEDEKRTHQSSNKSLSGADFAGVFVGGAGAFYSMYRKITAAQRRDDEERKQR